ncbi:MAG: 23S rRNA (uridine(2552)-2'-O)-methyltransferase RlmE [Legionellaceae bacterium]|nr:23S rRNA (uridine(2552)-2'-O)-methyltransferase RlmE [Legionellaceae bacterium]
MSRSKSSSRWLRDHFNDVYVKKAQKEGYRSRAIYKLKEIDEKESFLRQGMVVVDLGAAPGGWTQYVVEKLQGKGCIIALDILPMDSLPQVHYIQGDFREEAVLEKLNHCLLGRKVDVLLSDMAPNMSGNAVVDISRAMYLAELALDFAQMWLKADGVMFIKVFHGVGFDMLVKNMRGLFKRVTVRKPDSSRASSRETYILAKGFRGIGDQTT